MVLSQELFSHRCFAKSQIVFVDYHWLHVFHPGSESLGPSSAALGSQSLVQTQPQHQHSAAAATEAEHWLLYTSRSNKPHKKWQEYRTNLKVGQGFYLTDRQPSAVCFSSSPPQWDSHDDDHSCYRQSSDLPTSALWQTHREHRYSLPLKCG